MKKVIISLLVAVFLFGCTDPGNGTGNNPNVPNVPNVPEIPAGKLPGKFSATVLSDAMGSNARGVSLGTYTVANSKSIYFLLRNVGDFPITNIALVPGKLIEEGGAFVPITDGGIMASPSGITVLETSGKASVETVIEVDINHGNIIGLISQQYIQKADFAGATLRITGKTKNEEGAVLDISLDADIETLIKVASFEVVYSLDNGATYQKAKAELVNHMEFRIPPAGKDYIKILNSGNVPLRYKSWSSLNGYREDFVNWITLTAGSYSNALTIIQLGTSVEFVIDTNGIAFDNGGIEQFVFRAGTSIVINNFYQANKLSLALSD